MGLVRVIGPATEPVAERQFLKHLHVDLDDELDLSREYIQAAREEIEERCGLSLLTQTWEASYDRFPRQPGLFNNWLWGFDSGDCGTYAYLGKIAYDPDATIRLPRPPLQTVLSLTYQDLGGVIQTLDPAQYQVDNRGMLGRVSANWGQIWPIGRWAPSSLVIRYTAGYGDTPDQVPALAKQAIRLLAGCHFENRVPTKVEWAAIDRLLSLLWTGEYV